MQTSLFSEPLPEVYRPELPGADLTYYPRFYEEAEAQRIFEGLHQQIAWRSDKVKVFGKVYDQPRLTAWYGNPGASYTYSGVTMKPEAWTPLLQRLKADAETAAGTRFNSVLLNLYRHGQDGVGWHADDEKGLGPRPIIASMSFGAVRRFDMKHRHDREVAPFKLPLQPGSLLVMAGDTQNQWKHQVPKTQQPVGPRINLTFRRILAAD